MTILETAIKLIDLLESYGLQQHVTSPTHIHNHILDLIITRQTDQLLGNTPCISRYISDHATVLCSIRCDKPPLSVRKVSYRKLKSVNVVPLNEDLATSELCQNPSDDLQELVSSYNNTLMAALDHHAPLITRTIVQRPRVPWFSQEIREAKRQRRKAEKRWRKSRLESDLAAFKAKRNLTTRLMNKARREFYSNFIDENSGDQKKLFRASQRLFNRTMDDGLPPNLDSRTFSNDLGTFFVQKIDLSARSLTPISRPIHMQKMTPRLLMKLCHHSLLLRCYQFEMLNSLSRTLPLNPALLTLCHQHWLANVRIFFQFSQRSLTTHYSPDVFPKFGKRL